MSYYKRCKQCGKQIEDCNNYLQEYCNGACKQKEYRERNRRVLRLLQGKS